MRRESASAAGGGTTATAVRAVHVVLPGNVDDPRAPSGGNAYDRRICRGLAATGWAVREVSLPGAWPRPDRAARHRLAATLADVPDGGVVLLDGLVAAGVPELLLPEAGRLRLTVLVHLPLADETGLTPDEADALHGREGRVLRAAAAVVATSAGAAGRLVERHALPPERVHVAAPGADGAPAAAGTDSGWRLLCVAALTPRKGHEVLVDALATITEQRWTCVCVGPLDRATEHVDRLREQIRRHRLTDRVQLAGPRTGDELAASYAGADLLVLPSRAETYGMVVTEALARGIPVLGTAVGGLPEALGRAPDGSLPGMLIPPDDPAALATALRSWLAEPPLRAHLRAAARARRATLTGWDVTCRAVADVLDRVREAPWAPA